MKFTLVKDLRGNTILRPLLSGLLIFTILYLSADIILKKDHIGISYQTLSNTLYGNEDEFIEPVSFHFILELSHSDIFFMMMTLLSLSAIFSRLCKIDRFRSILIHTTMLSAILNIITLFLAYFLNPFFIYTWILCFWLWHIGAFLISFISLFHLLKKA